MMRVLGDVARATLGFDSGSAWLWDFWGSVLAWRGIGEMSCGVWIGG